MGGTKLPAITARELIRVLKKAGFTPHHQRGSHVTLKRSSDDKRVVVPVHAGKTIKKGTLKGILDDAGLSLEDFHNLRNFCY